MKQRTIKITAVIIMVGIVVACSIPGQELFVPAPPTSTPNQTMTALFAPPINIASSTFSVAQIASITSKPSQTPVLTETSTPTVTASATPTTTVTSSPTTAYYYSSCYRTGERFDAVQFTPTIDGVWDEWSSTQYSANYVVYGAENWVNSDDLGASFRVAWDSSNLYIAAKVGDDHYVQNASGQDMYKGDSLEILLDKNLCGDYYSNVLSSDDYQLGISPGRPDVNGPKEAFLWFPSGYGGTKSSVSISSVAQSGIYRVEAAIPWSLFGVSAWSGETFGFAFSVSDNDDTSTNAQHTMVSSVATRRLTRPMTWGTLSLR